MVIFPLLENSLRGIFVCANDIPSARMTAESDVLCLSLDIILAQDIVREQYILKKQSLVKDASGTDASVDLSALTWGTVASTEGINARNLVFDELGNSTCNALFDVRSNFEFLPRGVSNLCLT